MRKGGVLHVTVPNEASEHCCIYSHMPHACTHTHFYLLSENLLQWKAAVPGWSKEAILFLTDYIHKHIKQVKT